MNNLSDGQRERLERIRERQRRKPQRDLDIDFLLSLIDSKAAEGDRYHEGFDEAARISRVVGKLSVEDAASQMRDKCVEAVIDYFGGLTSTQVNRDDLVAALKSLTLEEKQQS